MKLYEANTWEEAVEQGWYRRPWHDDEELEPHKPVLTSYGIWHDLELEEPPEIFAKYLAWRASGATAPAGHQFEAIASNGKRVWVVDDGDVITICYPYEA